MNTQERRSFNKFIETNGELLELLNKVYRTSEIKDEEVKKEVEVLLGDEGYLG